MGFWKDMFSGNSVTFHVINGRNHLFTSYTTLTKKDGEVFINNKYKVQVVGLSEYRNVTYGKSAGKKIAGAVAGGLLTGGVGAVVGALAVGNKKKQVEKYDVLTIIDNHGMVHEAIIKHEPLNRAVIQTFIN